jgi:hypothetical protein
MSKPFVEESKRPWHAPEGVQPSNEQLFLGCLQRIATANEAMASNWLKMESELITYKRWYNEEVAKNHKAAKQIAAYQGHIKRMKKQAAAKPLSDQPSNNTNAH